MKFGDKADKIIKAALEEGDEIPESIRNKPVLNPENEFYWRCFWDLSSDRKFGDFGIFNITWQSIYNYCQSFGLSADMSRDVFCVVRQVDNYYCNKINTENKKKMNKKNGNKRI